MRDETARRGTNGSADGTNGTPAAASPLFSALLRNEAWAVPAFAVGVAIVMTGVNMALFLIEDLRAGRDPAYAYRLVTEATGAFGAVALMPAVIWWTRLLARAGTSPAAVAAGHAAGLAGFWLAHLALMALGRFALMPLIAGKVHHFDLALSSQISELLKDGVTYTVFVVLTLLWDHWKSAHLALAELIGAQAGAPDAPGAVLALRSGSETVFVRPDAIRYVSAAGNYVEIHETARRPHFVRASLKEITARLPASGFARIHRSHLVNRAAIAALTLTGTGDFTARLHDGTELPVSRRYRDQLG